MFGDIRNTRGERLDFTFHPGAADAKKIAVLGHGVTGNKDRPFVAALAEGLSAAGIPALRFSFAGNGQSQGAFVDCTVSKEVEDLGAILDAIKGKQVCYVGHSMGGAVGVLRASSDSRINYLISLAGMVHTKAFAEREFGSVTPGSGFMWDEPSCPLSQAYMDDMAKIGSVLPLAKQIKVPWLLVHGVEDDVVPVAESEEIYALARPPKELIKLNNCNHVFAGDAMPVMVRTVVEWLKRQR